MQGKQWKLALGAGLVTGEPARCTILGSTGMHMRALPAADVKPNPDLPGDPRRLAPGTSGS